MNKLMKIVFSLGACSVAVMLGFGLNSLFKEHRYTNSKLTDVLDRLSEVEARIVDVEVSNGVRLVEEQEQIITNGGRDEDSILVKEGRSAIQQNQVSIANNGNNAERISADEVRTIVQNYFRKAYNAPNASEEELIAIGRREFARIDEQTYEKMFKYRYQPFLDYLLDMGIDDDIVTSVSQHIDSIVYELETEYAENYAYSKDKLTALTKSSLGRLTEDLNNVLPGKYATELRMFVLENEGVILEKGMEPYPMSIDTFSLLRKYYIESLDSDEGVVVGGPVFGLLLGHEKRLIALTKARNELAPILEQADLESLNRAIDDMTKYTIKHYQLRANQKIRYSDLYPN